MQFGQSLLSVYTIPTSRAIIAATACAIVCALPARGENEGGLLLTHFNPSLTYSADVTNWNGRSGVACFEALSGDCLSYDAPCSYGVDVEPTSPGRAGDPDILFVLAAFPQGACVSWKEVAFGLHYDQGDLFIAEYGSSSLSEASTPGWPGSNSGTILGWSTPRTAPVTEVAWMLVYAYAPASVRVTAHPTVPTVFTDAATPAASTAVAGFGQAGMAGAEGVSPDQATSADVRSWGTIKVMFAAE